mgnify:CR=1 FL=1
MNMTLEQEQEKEKENKIKEEIKEYMAKQLDKFYLTDHENKDIIDIDIDKIEYDDTMKKLFHFEKNTKIIRDFLESLISINE